MVMCVQGPGESGEVTCRSCGAESRVQRSNLRCVTFPKSPEDIEKEKAKVRTQTRQREGEG
jgi:hypothetical protein